ncbi:MAG: peptidase M61 [Cyclobacteriaceae bacterium]|nr:peptidase M61 [Cyclobacteriaceae bacterium]
MKGFICAITVVVFATSPLFSQEKYTVSLDLASAREDKLTVVVRPPAINRDTIEFHMPKIVPGTYSISDFGRVVSGFQALDNNGMPLDVVRLSVNRWQIANARSLHSITYRCDDTFDKSKEYRDNFIFEPGGTNIDADREAFVLNTFGFVGYVEGMKFFPFELRVSHPSQLYGATSLKRATSSAEEDVFTADNYNFLADAPILYCRPDTVTKKLAGADILVAVYSPNGVLKAREVMDKLNDLMEAQAQYLGGSLPVDRYAYLVYLLDKPTLTGAMGALEHSYSSLYTLPEANIDLLGQTIRDVAAHEFLHIVTPLNIHSEQIHEFDYIDPKMSKHLWLYEGVTEYSAMQVQVRNGLYSPDVFLDNIKEKMSEAATYPLVAFTEMSEKILEPDFEPMYPNVYAKGALIGMCLDLHLLHYSDGKMDLRKLLGLLSQTYGPNLAFEDARLFDIINELTQPEIGEFLQTYVGTANPLPLVTCLAWAGIQYEVAEELEVATLGNIGLGLGENQEIMVTDVSQMNAFGRKVGYKEGDVFQSINGTALSLSNVQKALEEFQLQTKRGQKVKITVIREGKAMTLKAKAMTIRSQGVTMLSFDPNADENQLLVRKNWLGVDF